MRDLADLAVAGARWKWRGWKAGKPFLR